MNAGRCAKVPWMSASDSGSSMYFCKRAPQRTSAVGAIDDGFVEDPLAGLFGHRDGDRALRQVRVQLLHHQFDDLDQVDLGQRAEDDDFVQTVEELRIEGALHFVPHHVLDLG